MLHTKKQTGADPKSLFAEIEALHTHVTGSSDRLNPVTAIACYKFLIARLRTWQAPAHHLDFDCAVKGLVKIVIEEYERTYYQSDRFDAAVGITGKRRTKNRGLDTRVRELCQLSQVLRFGKFIEEKLHDSSVDALGGRLYDNDDYGFDMAIGSEAKKRAQTVLAARRELAKLNHCKKNNYVKKALLNYPPKS